MGRIAATRLRHGAERAIPDAPATFAVGTDPTAFDYCDDVLSGGREEKDYTPRSGRRTSSTGTLLRRTTLRLTLPMMASPSRPCG